MFVLVAGAAATLPTPAPHTRPQIRANKEAAHAARAAAAAARPLLIEMLNSSEMRQGLEKCCPHLASMSSEHLLDQIGHEIGAAELVHNFKSSPKANSTDQPHNFENLPLVEKLDWLPNLYQAQLLSGVPITDQQNIEDAAEVAIFGLPSFQQFPLSWTEAADRFPYVALNWAGVDAGNPGFGDVCVVFNNNAVQSSVQVAALDTGIWEMMCNHTSTNRSWEMPINCSVPLPVTGTFEHFEHALLASFGFWGNGTSPIQEALRFLSRGPLSGKPYLQAANISSDSMIRYLETDIIANVRFSQGVKFIVGTFGSLFGTDLGRQLQVWCASRGWALVWAFGPVGEGWDLPPSQMNKRMIDPSLSHLVNSTLSDKSVWEHQWLAAAHIRAHKKVISEQHIQEWWAVATRSQTHLAPITATACADHDRCIGTTVLSSHADCVCYHH